MKIKKNITKILIESYKWRKRDLLEKKGVKSETLTLSKVIYSNIYYSIIGLIISVTIANLFKESITTFVITSLSIFIGLFISILILIFDKFLNHNENYKKKKISSDSKANFIRTRNFTRRFVFVLLESLIIAFVTIILLLITLVFNELFLRDILEYNFVYINKIKIIDIWILLQNSFIILIKTITIILMIRFCVFLFFLFGSLGEYMKGVLYDKVDI